MNYPGKAVAGALIQRNDTRLFVIGAGSGGGFYNSLCLAPGASALIAGGLFPYATVESDRLVGHKIESYVSRENAIELSMMAYVRACQADLCEVEKKNPVGFAMSAAISGARVRRGGNRAFYAITTNDGTFIYHETLTQGSGWMNRSADSEWCDTTSTYMLNNVLGLPISEDIAFEKVSEDELRGIFFKYPVWHPDGSRAASAGGNVFLPGSFNPLHHGHERMATEVERFQGKRVAYMLTADSVHKPPLSVSDMLRRAASVRHHMTNEQSRSIVFTQNDPKFVDKARAFPGSIFVIGADTAVRLMDPKWYGDDKAQVFKMLQEIEDSKCQFYVFGREVDGVYMEPSKCHPIMFGGIFTPMAGKWEDISSSKIRAAYERKDL